ncbi:MAG: non-homologous end-joining DNA ligase [Dehalococcoidia bacterium]
MDKMRIGPHTVETSNADKVLFPDDGITKGDLIEYYRQIADTMLPHIEGRPVAMHRFPDGLAGEGFYQKDAPDYFPDWVTRVSVKKENGTVEHVICDKAATLVYLANQACVTPHVWLSRLDDLNKPDLLIFDLDPPDGKLKEVRFAARALRDVLGELGLAVFIQTTGSRGFHVVVPLDRSADFDTVRTFAQEVAELLARREPDRLTTEQYKKQRRGRVFLDTVRNSYAQTFAAPYAVRPRPGAPVATPIDWAGLGKTDSQRYNIGNIFRRLGQKGDPWKGMRRHARSLSEPRRRLDAMISDERS